MPSTYGNVETEIAQNTRVDRFTSVNGSLEVRMLEASFPMTIEVRATGDSPLGRGVRGAIPLHLVFDSKGLRSVERGIERTRRNQHAIEQRAVTSAVKADVALICAQSIIAIHSCCGVSITRPTGSCETSV